MSTQQPRPSAAARREERREQRHRAARERILYAAWELARERGLMGWSLSELGAAVGMRAPSLYVYFANKDAIYDELFAQGCRELLDLLRRVVDEGKTPTEQFRDGSRVFLEFAVADPARLQLLFLRVIPTFIPSQDSYALAMQITELLTENLYQLGITDGAAADLWTATLTGLATQQVSNEPGGQRWVQLVDRAALAFLATAAVQSQDPGRRARVSRSARTGTR
ncbi:TetR/AcrR family transcriptional regulator [Jatrophihabitans sp. DSM 45814]